MFREVSAKQALLSGHSGLKIWSRRVSCRFPVHRLYHDRSSDANLHLVRVDIAGLEFGDINDV